MCIFFASCSTSDLAQLKARVYPSKFCLHIDSTTADVTQPLTYVTTDRHAAAGGKVVKVLLDSPAKRLKHATLAPHVQPVLHALVALFLA